jgi:YesN/AraC family two-component response regulator
MTVSIRPAPNVSRNAYNPSSTIGEIAESLGYCDQTYFNFMYKKIVGHPPSHTLKIQNPVQR